MTAYGAAFSLKNTIEYMTHSDHISLVEPSLEIIQPAHKELQPLQEILERLDSSSKSRSRKKVNEVDGRIKDIIWEFEDKLDSLLYQQILSQMPADQVLLESLPSETIQFQSLPQVQQEPTSNIQRRRRRRRRILFDYKGDLLICTRTQARDVFLFSIALHPLQDDVSSFIDALKDMEREYTCALHHMPEEPISSRIGFAGTNSKMIGLSDQFQQVKRDLMQEDGAMNVHALVGTAGVGKTTLAEEIYQDPDILSHFDCRAWITVSRKPQHSMLLRGMLAQLCGVTQGDQMLVHKLQGKKCLVVLDDVWEVQVLNSLISAFPALPKTFLQIHYRYNVEILVTSRERYLSEDINEDVYDRYSTKVVRFLNEEESKDLLCEKVFGGKDLCPDELDKAAAKIAKKCEGLPLMIVTVADSLLKSQNRDPKYWNDVAEKRNSVFKDAYDQITKVLYPSYDYLPQYLKMPFLHMGVFPSDCDTPPSKMINMLAAEGWFLYTKRKKSFEESVWRCLYVLCYHKNLVLFNKKSTFWNETETGLLMCKTYRLHSSWRYVCRGEAQKNKFYHVLYRLVDAEGEAVKGQRSLCLENNILFGITEFCNSVRLNCTSSARSLLFLGPYHKYPTPIDVGFKFLRELDALNLRFYTFPMEILTLVQLKYLALTCNGELPTTISKLFNLRVLIVHPHMSIRRCGAPSYVPIQIWDMQELEHIEILGKSLRVPSHAPSLEKLTTLVGVNASICSIFKLPRRIPKIRKLGVRIELAPYDDNRDLLSCFACISTLGRLETLKFSIINHVIKPKCVFSTTSPLTFPRGLKKLHLSGMGFPWDYMDVIGYLPNLQVLKLRSYAFRGSKWKTREGCFRRLQYLLIEDTDLVCLDLRCEGFYVLSYLSMKHCYKLKEIHRPSIYGNMKIEVVDCNPIALTWAKQLQPFQDTHLYITISSSFEKKPITINLHRYGGSIAKPNWYEDLISRGTKVRRHKIHPRI